MRSARNTPPNDIGALRERTIRGPRVKPAQPSCVTMGAMRTLLPVAAALASASACAPAAVQMAVPAPPAVERPSLPPSPFAIGERAEYGVSVLGIPAAAASVEVGRGRGGWTFEAEGAGLPWLQTFYALELRMEAATYGRDLLPGLLVRSGNNGGVELRRETRYYRNGRVRVQVRKPGAKRPGTRWRRTLPEALDPLGLLFRMRWAAAAGALDGSVWHSFDGVWTRRVTVRAAGGAEEVEVAAGRFSCRPYEMRMVRVKVKGDPATPGDPEDRTWKVWATDDDRYLPVLAEGMTPFGPASVSLEAYRPALPEATPGKAPPPRVAWR